MKRFRVCNMIRFPMTGNTELVYCSETRSAQILPGNKIRMVQSCSTFATLRQHAGVLSEQFGLGESGVDAIVDELKQFADSGLLLSDEDVVHEFAAASGFPDTPRISSLGVPTRSRPDNLQRCLESFAACASEFGREIRFVVSDGSQDAQSQVANQEVLSSIKRKFGAECVYIGTREKQSYLQQLADEADVPLDVVRFALENDEGCPVDTGCNRNALLLNTAGEMTVQVDDDTICCAVPSPDKREGLTLTSQYDPTNYWFFADETYLPKDEGSAALDFFSLHEQLLGKRAVDCISESSAGDLSLDQIDAQFMRRNRAGAGVVSVTALGVAGDSGIASSVPFLRLDGPSRGRLVQSEETYRYAMESHNILRAVPNNTIGNATYLSGMNMGLDNRQNLPPFMPVQRGQDSIFASLVTAGGEGYFGFLPWMLMHKRPVRWKQNTHQRASQFFTGEIIELLIGANRQLNGGNAQNNLLALGRILSQLGQMRPSDFLELVQQIYWSRAAQRISVLQHLSNRYQAKPEFWWNDVNDCLAWTRDSMQLEDIAIPVDLAESFGVDGAGVLLQRLVRRLGELLVVWPKLREGAVRLKARGVVLGIEV